MQEDERGRGPAADPRARLARPIRDDRLTAGQLGARRVGKSRLENERSSPVGQPTLAARRKRPGSLVWVLDTTQSRRRAPMHLLVVVASCLPRQHNS